MNMDWDHKATHDSGIETAVIGKMATEACKCALVCNCMHGNIEWVARRVEMTTTALGSLVQA